VELGITTFGELTPDPRTGHKVSPQQRLADLVEEAVLAEQVGLDVFGVGEHHRPDFVVSAPEVVLAAIAARTERIRLSSAVTVLSSDDPIRVFQRFATVDLLSGGRAEVMAGRGSFTESFPLFGLDLERYDELFVDKLDELLRLRAGERADLVFPRPVQDPLPVWIAVGGTPQSAARAGMLGLPLAVAIIGGMPERFVPLVQLYRDAADHLGREPQPVAINSHTYVAATTAKAKSEYFGSYKTMMDQIGRERGWPPMTRQQFEALTELRGALVVGEPEAVAEKLLFQHELFGHDRFMAHISVGTLPHEQVLRAIELLGTEVAPAVRAEVARRRAPAPAAG